MHSWVIIHNIHYTVHGNCGFGNLLLAGPLIKCLLIVIQLRHLPQLWLTWLNLSHFNCESAHTNILGLFVEHGQITDAMGGCRFLPLRKPSPVLWLRLQRGREMGEFWFLSFLTPSASILTWYQRTNEDDGKEELGSELLPAPPPPKNGAATFPAAYSCGPSWLLH